MLSILNLTKTNKLILAAIAFLAVVALGSGRANAATLTVSGGCTLSEAIDSVNSATSEPGCSETGAYGTNDTINIPAGTFVLTADATLDVPVTILGAGMGQTTISGDGGSYTGFVSADDLTVKNLKITAYENAAIYTQSSNVVLDHIEVDGEDSLPYDGNMYGIELQGPDAGGASTVTANSVYVHNITVTTQYLSGFIVDLGGNVPGASMTVTLTNTTVADLHSSAGGVNSFMITAGFYQSSAGGTMNATVSNTTIDNISAGAFATGFGTFAFAAPGSDISLHTTVRSVTATGIDGSPSVYINQSPALFSAAAAHSGGSAIVVEEVENSLVANNKTDGTPSNCFAGDLSTNFGGGGGIATASIISNGHNISDDDTCADFTGTGDQQNVANIIPTLGPLQNNGGPVPTRALLAGSPAINTGGSVLGVTTDARGVARPDDCPSVGAFQFEGAVCGAATPSTPGSGNAGAPNTGIGAVSPAMTIIATSLGLGIIAYALRKRNAVK